MIVHERAAMQKVSEQQNRLSLPKRVFSWSGKAIKKCGSILADKVDRTGSLLILALALLTQTIMNALFSPDGMIPKFIFILVGAFVSMATVVSTFAIDESEIQTLKAKNEHLNSLVDAFSNQGEIGIKSSIDEQLRETAATMPEWMVCRLYVKDVSDDDETQIAFRLLCGCAKGGEKVDKLKASLGHTTKLESGILHHFYQGEKTSFLRLAKKTTTDEIIQQFSLRYPSVTIDGGDFLSLSVREIRGLRFDNSRNETIAILRLDSERGKIEGSEIDEATLVEEIEQNKFLGSLINLYAMLHTGANAPANIEDLKRLGLEKT